MPKLHGHVVTRDSIRTSEFALSKFDLGRCDVKMPGLIEAIEDVANSDSSYAGLAELMLPRLKRDGKVSQEDLIAERALYDQTFLWVRTLEIPNRHGVYALQTIRRVGGDKMVAPVLERWFAVECPYTKKVASDTLLEATKESLLTIPEIYAWLDNRDPIAQHGAYRALLHVDPQQLSRHTALLPKLLAPPPPVRAGRDLILPEQATGHISRGLAFGGEGTAVAVNELLQMGEERLLEAAVVSTLASAGEAVVPEITKAVASGDKQRSKLALRVLAMIGPAADESTEVLVEACKTRLGDARELAFVALASMGPRAVAPLETMAESGREPVNTLAIKALANMGLDAIDSLIEMAADESLYESSSRGTSDGYDHALEQPRVWAIQALGDIGPAAEKATPVILAAAGHAEFGLRHQAREALARLGHGARDAVPELIKMLSTPEDDQRRVYHDAVLAVLRNVGPDARSAAPVLLERLLASSRQEAFVRRNDRSVETLLAVGADSATIEKLFDLAQCSGSPSAELAKVLLWKIETGVDALPVLVRQLKSGPSATRAAAAILIGRVGPPAKAAVPALQESLSSSEDGVVQASAAYALARIGTGAAPAIPALEKRLENEQDELIDKVLRRAKRRIELARDTSDIERRGA